MDKLTPPRRLRYQNPNGPTASVDIIFFKTCVVLFSSSDWAIKKKKKKKKETPKNKKKEKKEIKKKKKVSLVENWGPDNPPLLPSDFQQSRPFQRYLPSSYSKELYKGKETEITLTKMKKVNGRRYSVPLVHGIVVIEGALHVLEGINDDEHVEGLGQGVEKLLRGEILFLLAGLGDTLEHVQHQVHRGLAEGHQLLHEIHLGLQHLQGFLIDVVLVGELSLSNLRNGLGQTPVRVQERQILL